MARQRFLMAAVPAALALLVTIGYAAPNGKGEPRAKEAAVDAKTSEVRGMYTKYCVACHAADGKGTVMRKAMPAIPDFTSGKWQDEVNDAQIKVSILEGKGTLMPSLRDQFNDEQAKEMVTIVRDFGRQP